MWDDHTWQIIKNWNTFAPWLSGVGSLSAVIVSLWLVRRDRFIRLLVESEYATSSLQMPTVRVTITNVGMRKANITEIYLKAGIFRPVVTVALPIQLQTAPVLPANLGDGDFVDIDLSMEWTAENLKTLFQKAAWWNGGRSANVFLRNAKIGIRTSTGKSIETKLNYKWPEMFLVYFRLANESI